MNEEAVVRLIGDDQAVPGIDGTERVYVSLDAAASTPALPAVADRVASFLPWYSSVHRGSGWKSQLATTEYEEARVASLAFAGRQDGDKPPLRPRERRRAAGRAVHADDDTAAHP
jgi:hypothetical protein